jgi:hypothetical protein
LSTRHEIRRWLEATDAKAIPTGQTVDQAIEAGRVLLNELRDCSTRQRIAEDPDVLYGMWRYLESQNASVESVTCAYDFVDGCSWASDEFDERQQLLGSLSHLAWSDCRKRAAFGEMQEWEKRCLAHLTSTRLVRDFLALPYESRTRSINDRFLGDPSVMIGVCEVLHDLRNKRPLIAAREGSLTYQWIVSDETRLTEEEAQYLAGDLAYSVAGSHRQLGHFRLHEQWLSVARAHFIRTVVSEPLLARLEWSRLAACHSLNRPEKTLEGLPAVRAVFRRHHMAEDELKCDFLEANALKCTSRQQTALELFDAITRSELLDRNPLIAALTFVSIGELHAQLGNPRLGFQFLAESQRHVKEADSPQSYGQFHGVTAEILKNEGQLAGATEEYGKSIEIYRNAGMTGQETYVRLLRADALLAASRDDEAIHDLLCALPVIEREERDLEQWAATALLKESLRRKNINSATVAQVRNWHFACRERQ